MADILETANRIVSLLNDMQSRLGEQFRYIVDSDDYQQSQIITIIINPLPKGDLLGDELFIDVYRARVLICSTINYRDWRSAKSEKTEKLTLDTPNLLESVECRVNDFLQTCVAYRKNRKNNREMYA